jgi:hypothetical protein
MDQRARYLQMTPAQRELKREYERIYKEAQRRRQGIKPTTNRRHTPIDYREAVYLPVDPLVFELHLWPGTWEELARRSGVPSRTIYRFVHGESVKVQIDTADKLALALGVPSKLIWGDRW